MIFLRSTLFNLVMYGASAIACILCLPGLLLPRKGAMAIVYAYVHTIHFLEKWILGLDYEVRGREFLPRENSYIVAAKHQSAYETFKLHILFTDPAIVLKKELLNIPLWGWFLSRIRPIAIDRKQGRKAVRQIIDGARKVAGENRPIVIFPQGTRVYPWQTPEEKPYKNGAARMYEATGMTIVPLALNTGLFWPRTSWIKRPGKVIFEFLPPIPPGKKASEIAEELETRIESACKALEAESRAANKHLLPAPQTGERKS